ncbi:MAG: M56 family metallopeptidase, partial [Flavisolibacter sp.]
MSLSNDIVRAICLTLIHSLWQGLLAAVLCGLIIFFTRRTSSRLRYSLLTIVFSLFLITATITFFIQIQHDTTNKNNKELSQTSNANFINDPNTTFLTEKKERLIDKIENFSNKNADYIVATWFIIMLFHCVRLTTGIHYIHKIRYKKTVNPPDDWKIKLGKLVDKLGLTQKIVLMQSALVKMPVVIGTLKPVILLPIGLISNLSSEQVEAILLHELAHIKRKDFLINFLQSIADSLFFFNPGFIWISSLIREEREACCDEIALTNGIDKHTYLEALITFQESRMPGIYAMAFGSRRSYLFNRVKKILTRENKKLNHMEKILLLAGILSITAFSFIGHPKQIKYTIQGNSLKTELSNSKNSFASSESILKTFSSDTTPKKIRTVTIDKNKTTIIESEYEGKRYIIKKTNNELTSLSINGQKIPKEDFGKYQEIVEQIELQGKKEMEKNQEEFKRNQIEMNRAMDEQKRAFKEHEQMAHYNMERNLEMQKEILDRKQMLDQEMQEKVQNIQREMENLEQMKKNGKNNDR